MEDPVIRIPPYHYVHVLDLNSNVTRVEVGPHTYIRQDHERWVLWGSLLPTAKDVDAVAGGGEQLWGGSAMLWLAGLQNIRAMGWGGFT